MHALACTACSSSSRRAEMSNNWTSLLSFQPSSPFHLLLLIWTSSIIIPKVRFPHPPLTEPNPRPPPTAIPVAATRNHRQNSPSSAHALAISNCSSVLHTNTLCPPPFLAVLSGTISITAWSSSNSFATLCSLASLSTGPNPKQRTCSTTALLSTSLFSPIPPAKTRASTWPWSET